MTHLRDSTVAGPVVQKGDVLATTCEYPPPFQTCPITITWRVPPSMVKRFRSRLWSKSGNTPKALSDQILNDPLFGESSRGNTIRGNRTESL